MSAIRSRRRYRAPAGDRSWLIAMSTDATSEELPCNSAQPARVTEALRTAADAAIHTCNSSADQPLLGLRAPFSELRRQAREDLVDMARVSTSALRRDFLRREGPGADAPIVMTGHQPSLFHPGVWAKNFAADRVARMVVGHSINLVVDTDVLHDRSILLPEHADLSASFVRLDYDAVSLSAPYVESYITDEAAFLSFGSRVTRRMRSEWDISPLIEENWVDDHPYGPNEPISNRLAAMRHAQEWRWGLRNHELPLSHLERTPAFIEFFLDIVRRADEFLGIHNRAVAEYRHVHKLRSQSHPVRFLERVGERVELPFWTWGAGEHSRLPMYAVRTQEGIELSTPLGSLAELPMDPLEGEYAIADQFASEGQRIAPRALTTTLFCRVWLADLFIHGIGGAIYDQMTDRLIEEFYGLEPSPFLVLTGTLQLPIRDVPDISVDDISRQQRLLRELAHQPERHLIDDAHELLAEKAELVAEENRRASLVLTKGERRVLRSANHDRWVRIRQINRELSSRHADHIDVERKRLNDLRKELLTRQLLKSREFSAWLYPEVLLREFFGALID